MEAVSRGAKEADGEVWGVTLDLFGGKRSCNSWLDREIPTDDFPARLRQLTNLADAYIAMEGGIGTLLEIALVWNSIFTGVISPRPAVLVGAGWKKTVDALVAETCVTSEQAALMQYAQDGQRAVEVVLQELGIDGRVE
jgi:predicted Rossmann-fold nucleotide-binding protein